MTKFLNSTPARVVSLLLVAQAALLYSSIRPEAVPPGKPLAEFPKQLGEWQSLREGVVEPEVMAVLQADDVLTRIYGNTANGQQADLYIAAFRSQRNGKAPHSPKNCLPGNGWMQVDSAEIRIDDGAGATIPVNRYIIQYGDDRSLVLYWYQSRDRAVAGEFKAKFWVIADAIRYNRTDTALIRVIVPISGKDVDRAQQTAVDFVQATFPTIRRFLPS
ncbi:MAG TPA: EpsI family protein [Bryobacteraceae bacterium]|nr:EpsI family protein [Bryobacteraceae bacterium]